MATNQNEQQQLEEARELLKKASGLHTEVFELIRSGVYKAMEVGDCLLKAKKLAGHGNWERECKKHFRGSPSRAKEYMYLAKKREELKDLLEKDPEASVNTCLQRLRKFDDPPANNGMEPWQSPREATRQFAYAAFRRNTTRGIAEVVQDWPGEMIWYLAGSPALRTPVKRIMDSLKGEVEPIAKAAAAMDEKGEDTAARHRAGYIALKKLGQITPFQRDLIHEDSALYGLLESKHLKPTQKNRLKRLMGLKRIGQKQGKKTPVVSEAA